MQSYSEERVTNLASSTFVPTALLFFLFLSLSFLFAPNIVSAQSFEYSVVTTGLALPTNFAFVDPENVIVGEKSGHIIWQDLVIDERQTIYNIPNINTYNDRGLVGMTIDPDFTNNGYIYLSYTHENSPDNYEGPKTARIVRVQYDFVTEAVDPDSYTILLGTVAGTPSQPSCDDFPVGSDCIASNSGSHSGGGLRFGPDGKLYASIGDGAGFLDIDPYALNALDLGFLTGKILRLNPDGSAPSDNPFFEPADPTSNQSKVYAYGIRNSYRFGFAPNGDLISGEVGWFSHEELNVVHAGDNLGWPCYEGPGEQVSYYPTYPTECGAVTNNKTPAYYYGHIDGAGNAVTGGSFGTHSSYDTYASKYFFGDYSEDFIAVADYEAGAITNVETILNNPGGPVDIQTGPDGHIYYLAIYTGQLRKVVPSDGTGPGDNNPPSANYYVDYDLGDAPVTLTFHGEISTDPDNDTLTYEWDFGDGSTGTGSTPSNVYTENGDYVVTLTVTDPSGASDSYAATIIIGSIEYNAAPTHSQTTHYPQPVYLGIETTIETTFTNDTGGDDDYLIYWEVYNSNNVQVYNHNTSVAASERGNIVRSFAWVPPGLDTYRIQTAFFSSDWRNLYEWNTDVATFTVVNRVGTTNPMELDHVDTTGDDTVEINQLTQLSVEVSNSGKTDTGIVYLEVRDQADAIVHNEGITTSFTGESNTVVDFDWIPDATGSYEISIGLFRDGWQDQFGWWARTHSIEVQDSGTTTPPTDPMTLDFVSVANLDPVTPGETVGIDITISNTGGSDTGIAYIEIYDANDSRVQLDTVTDTFNSGESTVHFDWSTAQPGNYTVSLGLFTENWQDQFGWWAYIIDIEVAEADAPSDTLDKFTTSQLTVADTIATVSTSAINSLSVQSVESMTSPEQPSKTEEAFTETLSDPSQESQTSINENVQETNLESLETSDSDTAEGTVASLEIELFPDTQAENESVTETTNKPSPATPREVIKEKRAEQKTQHSPGKPSKSKTTNQDNAKAVSDE